jgi:glycosyltransferase involved in cell wall biosynthesis
MRPLIFAWNYEEWGGAQIYFLAIMKLARSEWDVRVVLPANSPQDIRSYLDQLNVPYECLDACIDTKPAPTIKRKLERQWRRIRTHIHTWQHLKKYDLKNSILHIETAPWQDWVLLTALSLRGANVFVTMHNFLPRYLWWREAIWKVRLQLVSRLPGFHILASNHDTRNKLKGWVKESFRERIPVTYTCVNPPEIDGVLKEEIDSREIRRRFGIDEDGFVVLSVGQFVDRKGRWVLLDAAKRVAEMGENISFVWVTPKLPDPGDAARVESYGLGGNFRLVLSETVGKNRHEVLTFFRMANAFALPSYVEGLPIALLEAMALGLPSVSTNVFAIPEALKHGETGLLVDAGDSQALADAIIELKRSDKLRRSLSQEGRNFVMTNFDEREASRIAIQAYKECFADA